MLVKPLKTMQHATELIQSLPTASPLATNFLLIRCFGVITRFCLVAGQVFNRAMVAVNTWLNHYRQRVEHTMADIKDHAIWKRKFRGRWGR